MISFFASEPHFLDHLAPIARALPPDHLEGIFVDRELLERARSLELEVEVGLPPEDSPTVVAAIGDYKRTAPRAVIFAEHGAGQSYSSRHPSYVGGKGKDRTILFLLPSLRAARRNLRTYPRIPYAVIGCPKLDSIPCGPARGAPPVAAISFHWRCRVAPETSSALDHYREGLPRVVSELRAAGVELLGHAHPRIASELEEVYRELEVEFVRDFEEVLERAHLYAVDNSSTLFEFAASGRPVVLLNAPQYRRRANHGLRFWTEASVGIQVEGPSELSGAILRGLEDPPEIQRSREEALERVYSVRDGTSSELAATAILEIVSGKKCPLCGSDHRSCTRNGPTTVLGVDEITKEAGSSMKKRRYPNPNGRGFLRLSDERARSLGLEPIEETPQAPEPPSAPPVAAPEPEVRTSSSRRRYAGEELPEGALAPGGPTARARHKMRETPSPRVAPSDVLAATAADLKKTIRTLEDPSQIRSLALEELAGKQRGTVLAALEARLAELEEQ